MAQIFNETSNVLAKLSLMLGASLPVAGLYIASTVTRSPANTKAGVAINQPVPFSHKHHIMELGIDCRYCHTSVEKGAVASVPTTETCMSCHSQVWTNSPLLKPVRDSYEKNEPLVWNKVNKVPEFVYFNHSIHINKGINCNQCHGAVQEMMMTSKAQPFSMDWCLTCHRDPAKFLREDKSNPNLTPRQQVFEPYKRYSRGEELTPREYDLIKGLVNEPSHKEIEEGKELVQRYKVETKQLKDCYICHR